MPKYQVIIILLLVTVMVCPSHQAPNKRRKKISKALTQEQMFEVDETIRLLKAGDSEIQMKSQFDEFVLVVGNTGAGKTTMTKFISEAELLESYDVGERFLIRDKHQKISQKSTVVSKTIFPDLIVDKSSNTAFYDLPGFSDTRNASIEIANSWFVKMVADRAQAVKLLFVVNYSSLRNGETRTDFKVLLEHAIELVKDPMKFKDSIMLLCTKVETQRSHKDILNGIKSFLENVQENLGHILDTEDKIDRANDLLSIFLSEDEDEQLDRITYFRQPTEAGALTSMPEVMEQKERIHAILASMQYTPKEEDDFGVTISPTARILINKVVQNLNSRIADAVKRISLKVESYFQSQSQNNPLPTVGSLFQLQVNFENSLPQLISDSSTTRPEFFASMEALLAPLELPDVDEEFSEMKNRDVNLNFFQQVNGSPIPVKTVEWATSMKEAARAAKISVRLMADNLNSKMQEDTTRLANDFQKSIQSQVSKSPSPKETLKTLSAFSFQYQSLLKDVLASTTFNEFVDQVKSLTNMDAAIASAGAPHFQKIPVDMTLKDTPTDPSPFRLIAWTKPLEKFGVFLQKILSDLEMSIKDAEHEQTVQGFNRTMGELEENMNRQLEEEQKRLQEMEEDARKEREQLEEKMQGQKKAFEDNLAEQEKKTQAKMNEMQEQVQTAQKKLDEDLKAEKENFAKVQKNLEEQAKETERRLEEERRENEKRVQEQTMAAALQKQQMDHLKQKMEDDKRRADDDLKRLQTEGGGKSMTCILIICWG